MLLIILRSYGWAAEIFRASYKGWHGFFAGVSQRPRFLHPKELRSRCPGLPVGACLAHLQYPGLATPGEFDPAPHGLLGLIGTGRCLPRLGASGARGQLGGRGFPQVLPSQRRGLGTPAWGPGPGPQRTKPQEIEDPHRPRGRPQEVGGVLGVKSPRWLTPQVAMVQGRRASEGETPTTVWLDPPTHEETRDFLAVSQAMRGGAFVLESFPEVRIGGHSGLGAWTSRRARDARPQFPQPRIPSPSPVPGI